MSSTVSSLLGFFAVIALIPFALWLLKRTPMGGSGTPGLMRTVAVLPIAANQRLLIVEVGSGDDKNWLVLGVTPAHIATLHTMAPQAVASAAVPLPPFAQLLAKHMPGFGAKHGGDDAR